MSTQENRDQSKRRYDDQQSTAPANPSQSGEPRSATDQRRPLDQDEPILRAIELVKVFKNNRGVHNVSFEVNRGEIVVLMGPNGAGKTTSFRMTCGIVEPDRGTVYLNGIDITDWPMFRRAREGGMGYLAQEQSIFRDLTVQDNLKGVMELLGFDRQSRNDRCNELLEQFDLTRIRKSKAKSLSGGEKRRLEIARALVSDPDIILLDEPFTGIDPVTIDDIQMIIRGLRDNGISILITDHQVREALQIADRCYIIRDGLVLCEGPPEEVIMNEEARKCYFGDDPDLGPSAPIIRSPSHLAPSGLKPVSHLHETLPESKKVVQIPEVGQETATDPTTMQSEASGPSPMPAPHQQNTARRSPPPSQETPYRDQQEQSQDTPDHQAQSAHDGLPQRKLKKRSHRRLDQE